MARFLLLVGCLVWGASFVVAQQVPPRQNPYVNDYAAVLAAADERELNAALAELQQQYNVEMSILIIERLANYQAGATIETFATTVFNAWALGDATRNDGILIVAAIEDRAVRLELGDGYSANANEYAYQVIQDDILPSFRNGEYGRGVLRGVEGVRDMLQREDVFGIVNAPPAPTLSWVQVAQTPSVNITTNYTSTTTTTYNTNTTINNQRTTSRQSQTAALAGLAAGAGGLLVVGVYGVRRFQRYRPRPCPNCSTKMQLLDENADDEHLDQGQRLEEMLGSVNYDIWECPACATRTVHHYDAFFSKHARCPQCRYRTLVTQSKVLQPATTHATGTRQIDQNCQHCQYHHTSTQVIPRRVEHHTSSGGSFGGRSSGSRSRSSSRRSGGFSSGGGASGKW